MGMPKNGAMTFTSLEFGRDTQLLPRGNGRPGFPKQKGQEAAFRIYMKFARVTIEFDEQFLHFISLACSAVHMSRPS
jgi:hypothetical protein